MEKFKTGAKYTAGVFAVLLVASLVETLVYGNNYQQTPQAQYNTMRNSFISGCVKESNNYSQTLAAAGITAQGYCGCAFDRLNAYYSTAGDTQWYKNDTLVSRITTQGYNQAETSSIEPCLGSNQ